MPRARVTSLTDSGDGIVRESELVVFIPGAIPGDEIGFHITRRHKNHADGLLTRIITPSPDRIEPICANADECGGCQLAAMAYPAQLLYKSRLVVDKLKRISGFENAEELVRDTDGMENPLGYRAKAIFRVGGDVTAPKIGLFAKGSHKIIPLSSCPCVNPVFERILRVFYDYIRHYSVKPYNEESGKGLLRQIVLRAAYFTGEVMVMPVVNKEEPRLPHENELISALREAIDGFIPSGGAAACKLAVVTVNSNLRRDNVVLGDKCRVIYGKNAIREEIGGLMFDISPLSFFQVNPVQTEKLYNYAKTFAGNASKLCDLYCGTGTITLALAGGMKTAVGVELSKAAVADAKNNAAINRLAHKVRFFAADAAEWLGEYVSKGKRFDVCVIDPPRQGCSRSVLDALIEAKPERIVYISCNPATLARDLADLRAGYSVDIVQPVDMFPYTGHVECVALLTRTDN